MRFITSYLLNLKVRLSYKVYLLIDELIEVIVEVRSIRFERFSFDLKR